MLSYAVYGKDIIMKRTITTSLIILFAVFSVVAQKEKFEAIYIYNFTKKIEWPKEATTGDFIIGVLGNSAVTPELKKVAAAKKVGSRTIVVKEFSDVSNIESCHILYISPEKTNKLQDVKNHIGNNPTLFVTDKKGMAKSGAAINFFEKDGKLKFELNKNNAAKQGLKISTELEKLAIVV